jgi:transposase
LDLAALGFIGTVPKATARPGYAPADLLKLYIYGYLNRVRSSRRLEDETHRNIEVIWLLRHLKPDFKTIADFRRDNRAAFRAVFREFVLLVPPARPVRPGAAGGRQHPDQGRQQQGPQFHAGFAAPVH